MVTKNRLEIIEIILQGEIMENERIMLIISLISEN